MKGLVQRVSSASVTSGGRMLGQIKTGIVLLLGIEKNDSEQQIHKMVRKVLNYRIFADSDGKMNLSLVDIEGDLLVVSQFTLVADTSKGNRPGFSSGATPAHGEKIYNEFITHLAHEYKACQTGKFGAEMAVTLVNDGPATFMLET